MIQLCCQNVKPYTCCIGSLHVNFRTVKSMDCFRNLHAYTNSDGLSRTGVEGGEYPKERASKSQEYDSIFQLPDFLTAPFILARLSLASYEAGYWTKL
jgi:hypothetical protein